jgi:hypothetical protein
MRSERTAQAYAPHPALLRMLELESLRDLRNNANARIYIGFDKHLSAGGAKESE